MNKKAMERLKYERIKKNKTQKDIADFLGLTKQAVQRYEAGLSTPKLKTWQKLSNFFKVNILYLQGLSDIRNDSQAFSNIDSLTSMDNLSRDDMEQLLKNHGIVIAGEDSFKMLEDYLDDYKESFTVQQQRDIGTILNFFSSLITQLHNNDDELHSLLLDIYTILEQYSQKNRK
ncbi:helix-turn-helix domain-containing protein [Fructobacillus tropaeoli]|uniref:Helix-turn-helix domain protein n=1 Tax=Fructobacillus tropaeoli TaxID=709323 RepID=A0A3F3HDE1_9LACO|nr:helix-turn-helix transcriptional regulator [Fructobacillus tropaeoli]GAP04920.1 helix-turn-helix domain protein [Fructobacillus tropaeoli]